MNIRFATGMAMVLAACLMAMAGPAGARFLSPDPAPVEQTDGGNFNRYWYAKSNPYRYVDPDGREAGAAYKAIHDIDSGISRGTMSAAEVSTVADFLPVIGDIKGVAEAFQEPSLANIAAAAIGVVPGLGDLAGKGIKELEPISKLLEQQNYCRNLQSKLNCTSFTSW